MNQDNKKRGMDSGSVAGMTIILDNVFGAVGEDVGFEIRAVFPGYIFESGVNIGHIFEFHV